MDARSCRLIDNLGYTIFLKMNNCLKTRYSIEIRSIRNRFFFLIASVTILLHRFTRNASRWSSIFFLVFACLSARSLFSALPVSRPWEIKSQNRGKTQNRIRFPNNRQILFLNRYEKLADFAPLFFQPTLSDRLICE